jgi:hypothetical protein
MNKAYTHFIYSEDLDHLHSGWEYAEDAKDALKELVDGAKQFGIAGVSSYRVYTRAGLLRKGFDPQKASNWQKRGFFV